MQKKFFLLSCIAAMTLSLNTSCKTRAFSADQFDETEGDVVDSNASEVMGAPTAKYDFTARTGLTKTEADKDVPGYGGNRRDWGLTRLRPVLRGVVYRGGSGDSTPLHAVAKKKLCEFGFKKAIYGYNPSRNSMSPDCLEDYQALSPGRQETAVAAMKIVRTAILHPEHGPVLVHCYGGNHASGALAAITLIQFCGYDRQTALNYWERNRNGVPFGAGYPNQTVGRYQRQTGSEWEVPKDVLAKICPQ